MKIFHVVRLRFFNFIVLEQDCLGFINWGTSWTKRGAYGKAYNLGAIRIIYKRL